MLFVSGVFDKTVDGFKVMFSSPMDTDNYELSWIVTDALLGSSSSSTLSVWLEEVYYDWSDPNAYDNYSYRHIATAYNMDRIINPDGPILNYGKMLNVNRIDPNNNADPNIVDLYN